MAKNKPPDEAAPKANGADAAKPLIAVMPRWLVVGIAVFCLLLVVAGIIWGIEGSASFDSTFTRYMLNVGLAVCLGMFLFVVYPWNYRLRKLPWLKLPMELVGPAALIVCMFAFLWKTMPMPETGRLHPLVDNEGQQLTIGELSTLRVRFLDGQDASYYAVPQSNLLSIYGVYVRYPEKDGELRAKVRVARNIKEEEVTFYRHDKGPVRLKLERE